MKTFAILAALVGGLAFVFVTLVPQPADAGWRRKAWRHGDAPGVNVTAVPRRGYFVPRRTVRRYGSGGYPYAYYPYWRKRTWGGWY